MCRAWITWDTIELANFFSIWEAVTQYLAGFLEPYAWKEVEQVGGQDYTLRYLNPAGRAMPATEIERTVYAEKL